MVTEQLSLISGQSNGEISVCMYCVAQKPDNSLNSTYKCCNPCQLSFGRSSVLFLLSMKEEIQNFYNCLISDCMVRDSWSYLGGGQGAWFTEPSPKRKSRLNGPKFSIQNWNSCSNFSLIPVLMILKCKQRVAILIAFCHILVGSSSLIMFSSSEKTKESGAC